MSRIATLAVCGFLAFVPQAEPGASDAVVDKLRADAAALRPLGKSDLVRAWFDATSALPVIAPRTVWRNADRSQVLLDAAGFDVVAFDVNDFERLAPIWRALGFADGQDDAQLRSGIFVWYTVARRRAS
ncbi:MAG: hypothetical protein SGJ11_17680 [Phycisphaerae bacterium]|nr:hypothetical protein [Phycisphaerae bacterium]